MGFDPITLALAKPKIIDLTQYFGVFDIPAATPDTLNELVIQMLSVAIATQGKAVQTYITCMSEFKRDASGSGLVIIRANFNGDNVDIPTTIIRGADGTVAQISASGLAETPGVGTVEEKIVFQFTSGEDTQAQLIIKADVIPSVSLEEAMQGLT